MSSARNQPRISAGNRVAGRPAGGQFAATVRLSGVAPQLIPSTGPAEQPAEQPVSRFAPPAHVAAYEPPVIWDAEFAVTPFDLLPELPASGGSEREWSDYVSHRKRIGDAVPISRYQVRMQHEANAAALFNELEDMRGMVPVDDPAWLQKRDAALIQSALAADPDATELIITRDMASNITVELDVPQDLYLRPNLQQVALPMRVKRAIGVATTAGLEWKYGPVGDRGATQVVRIPLRS
ncbi:hypothetical protein [Leucobacter sp. cx-169]|uniref:hypothetical protein n=1 Tax=Leucobacter sp. cx-169 TaxID=2770549 RepID=UPI00165E9200|nr:hypothetical protein [Leucobacter sp. cx-169]MBC9927343.1 hypothetical protein [Leucobacter sp. cx-169]